MTISEHDKLCLAVIVVALFLLVVCQVWVVEVHHQQEKSSFLALIPDTVLKAIIYDDQFTLVQYNLGVAAIGGVELG